MFKKILVPIDVDYPQIAVAVYQKAAELAKTSAAEIRLISVMPGFGMPIVAAHISNEVRNEAEKNFKAALMDFHEENCDESVTYVIRIGKNSEEIIKVADEWKADLIVVYHNRHREINEVFSDSCSRRVSEHAHCSVLRLRNIFE